MQVGSEIECVCDSIANLDQFPCSSPKCLYPAIDLRPSQACIDRIAEMERQNALGRMALKDFLCD